MSAPHRGFPDYKPGPDTRPLSTRRLPWFIAGVGIPLIALALINAGPAPKNEPAVDPASARTAATAQATVQTSASSSEPGQETGTSPSITDTPDATQTSPALAEPGEALTLTVRPGDSLDRLFARHDINRSDLAHIMQLDLARQYLRVIRPGDEILIRHDGDRLLQLARDINLAESLRVDRSADSFNAQLVTRQLDRQPVMASGTIDSSLFEAAAQAGISDRLIMNLAGIFAWDIDFVLDIRRGDRFKLIYEQLRRDGKVVGEGEILAAEFINQGEVFRAVRYQDPTGRVDYYTPDGHSVRKAFVRAPLSFSRISSNFNPRRRHPKLNTIRAHKGVDYAAPRGTPVKAAGDGKVIFRGRKGGYGNTIILQHGGNITTLYAHLNGFARTTRVGARVHQGDVIGFVGSTGLATGPHLHYEYRHNGVHLNPRTVKLPDAAPIDSAYMADFKATTRPLLQKLESQPTLLASDSARTTT